MCGGGGGVHFLLVVDQDITDQAKLSDNLQLEGDIHVVHFTVCHAGRARCPLDNAMRLVVSQHGQHGHYSA